MCKDIYTIFQKSKFQPILNPAHILTLYCMKVRENVKKMDEVKSKEESNVPVTVTNLSPTKCRYSKNVDCRMNKSSRVCRAKNLALQWKEPEIHRENSIKEILDSKRDGDIVRLKMKVLQKSETNQCIFLCYERGSK